MPFVQWDRFTRDEYIVNLYGWILRPHDHYKDFVVISADDGPAQDWWWITSSAAYSDEIAAILGQQDSHIPCERVQAYLDIPNAIRLGL